MANRIRCPDDYVEMTYSERDAAVGAGMSKEDWIGIGTVALTCVAMNLGIYYGNKATSGPKIEGRKSFKAENGAIYHTDGTIEI